MTDTPFRVSSWAMNNSVQHGLLVLGAIVAMALIFRAGSIALDANDYACVSHAASRPASEPISERCALLKGLMPR